MSDKEFAERLCFESREEEFLSVSILFETDVTNVEWTTDRLATHTNTNSVSAISDKRTDLFFFASLYTLTKSTHKKKLVMVGRKSTYKM